MMGYVARHMTKPAIIHIGNASLILGPDSVGLSAWVSRCEMLDDCRQNRVGGGGAIVCHFTLLISVNNHPCVDVGKCAPQVSETSVSMSNGAPGQ